MNVRRFQVESLDQLRIMAQRPVDAYILFEHGDDSAAAASASSISIIATGGIGGCMSPLGIVNATLPNGSLPAAPLLLKPSAKRRCMWS